MGLLETSFTCPNGHTFTANAKLRARCPECLVMAKRPMGVKAKEPEPVKEPVVEPIKEPVKEPVKSEAKLRPVLIKQGLRGMAKRKPPVVKRSLKPVKNKILAGRASAGLVRKHRIMAKVVPSVSRKPKKTSIAKVTKLARNRGDGRDVPYWQRVNAKYGFGR